MGSAPRPGSGLPLEKRSCCLGVVLPSIKSQIRAAGGGGVWGGLYEAAEQRFPLRGRQARRSIFQTQPLDARSRFGAGLLTYERRGLVGGSRLAQALLADGFAPERHCAGLCAPRQLGRQLEPALGSVAAGSSGPPPVGAPLGIHTKRDVWPMGYLCL